MVPGFEAHEEEALVTRGNAIQQTEAADARVILDAVSVREDRLDFLEHLVRSLERRRGRKLHVQHRVAVVFLGQKTRRHLVSQERIGKRETEDDDDADHSFTQDRMAPVEIAVHHLIEAAIEPTEESSQESFRLLSRPQQQRR